MKKKDIKPISQKRKKQNNKASSTLSHKKKRVSNKKKHNNKKKKKKKSTKKRLKNKRTKSIILEIIASIGIGITVSLIIFFYICSFETMDGNGMAGTIKNGDVALVNKRYGELKRFDVVSLKGVKRSGLVRIIGLPKESVRYKEDYLYINEQPVDEKFLIKEVNRYNKEGKIFTEGESGNQLLQVDEIPENYYLVLGDNRPYATDSRYYGLVSKEDIKGKATILISPLRSIDDF